MNYRIKYLPLQLFMLMACCTAQHVYSQLDNTFYLMHPVPQSNLLNPAVQPSCKWYIGIPGVASSHLSAESSAMTYRDLASGTTLRLGEIADRLHRSNFFGAAATLNPVSLGYRYRSLYFSFNISERVHVYQTLPGDLARTLLTGNGEYAGETVGFDGLRSAGSYLREYSLAVSRVLDRRMTVGIRAGLLFGKADLHTGRSDLNLETGRYSFDLLYEGNYLLNASLPITIAQDAAGNLSSISMDEIEVTGLLLNRRNPGISLDVGVIYRYDDRTTFSASLLDIGFIRWRSDVHNVNMEGSFAFSGVEPGTDIISFAFLEEMADSLLNAYDLPVSESSYTTFTPMQSYLGGSYRLKEHLTLGVVQRNLLLRNKLHASLTLLAQTELNDRFLLSVSWSAMNNSLKNLGAGIAYYGRGFQFHLVSDNIAGFFLPYDTRTVNLRAGCNILFGCSGERSSERAESSYGEPSAPGNCSWSAGAGNRDRIMKKARKKQNKL